MNSAELIILGMGNKLFGDDGIGIVIAQKLKEYFKGVDSIYVEESNWGGFRIIDLLSGYKNAIVVDAIQTGKHFSPGYIHQFNYTDLIHSTRMVSFHDINFATAVEFAKQLDIPMPQNIIIYAIEVTEINTLTELISPKVYNSINDCINKVLTDINDLMSIEVQQKV